MAIDLNKTEEQTVSSQTAENKTGEKIVEKQAMFSIFFLFQEELDVWSLACHILFIVYWR